MSARRIAIAMGAVVAVLIVMLAFDWAQMDKVTPVDEITGVTQIDVTRAGAVTPVPVTGFKGVQAKDHPESWRACMTLDAAGLANVAAYDGATPEAAPKWFKCYAARGISRDLTSGAARAVLGRADIVPGHDLVIAVYPDGRAFAWHQAKTTMTGKAE